MTTYSENCLIPLVETLLIIFMKGLQITMKKFGYNHLS
jgi:hypothetical protein